MENEKFQKVVLEHLVRLTQDNTEIKQRLDNVESSVIRIENVHGEKLQALFDAREVQTDVNQQIFDTLDRLEEKVDHLILKVSTHEAILKKVK